MEYLNFMENKNKRKQLGKASYILTVKNSDIRSARRFAVSNRSKLLSSYLKAHLTYELQILFQLEHDPNLNSESRDSKFKSKSYLL